MRILMISLDKKILDKNSAVARRMIGYGEQNELFILIPDKKKISFDLSPKVHVQSTGGHKLWQFFSLISLGGNILRNNDIAEITTQDPFFSGLVGVILKFFTSKKLEIQVHGDFFSNEYYRRSGIGNWLRYWLARLLIVRFADRLRVVGERVRYSVIGLGIDEKKIIVQPVAVDYEHIAHYEPRLNLRSLYPQYKKIFLFLGRLDPVKNIPWLVEIFSYVIKKDHGSLLLIVGEGEEKRKIEMAIKEYSLENNVKMEDWTDDPISYLKTDDCLLLPSFSESYSLVAMEAQAAGTPIIMTNVGVANYELKPSDKVEILPINDKEKWIEAILEV